MRVHKRAFIQNGETESHRVVVSDFDGTIVENDLPEFVLRRFGEKGWEEYNDLLAQGQLSLEECIEQQYGMIRAESKQQILSYIREHCAVRQGFHELVQLSREGRVRLVVASAGLDFCIDYALRINRLGPVEVVCPKAEFTPHGIRVTFPERLSASPHRDFKEALVARYQERGLDVTFVGDGLSDLSSVKWAHRIFVIEGSSLERECIKSRLSFTSITDFTPVLAFLKAATDST